MLAQPLLDKEPLSETALLADGAVPVRTALRDIVSDGEPVLEMERHMVRVSVTRAESDAPRLSVVDSHALCDGATLTLEMLREGDREPPPRLALQQLVGVASTNGDGVTVMERPIPVKDGGTETEAELEPPEDLLS